MPRHDWDDDTMTRERSDWRERGYDDRDRREMRERDRHEMSSRDRHEMTDRDRGFADRDDRFMPSRERDELREHSHRRDRQRSDFRERGRDRDDEWFGSDDHNRGIPMDETKRLIASNKVEGTPVYDRHGDKLGSIHNFMVDKFRGEIVYAVLKHSSGFLGLGERYYPLEWDQLTYDTRLGGYHVRMDEEDLKSFGSFDSEGRYHRRRIRSERDRY